MLRQGSDRYVWVGRGEMVYMNRDDIGRGALRGGSILSWVVDAGVAAVIVVPFWVRRLLDVEDRHVVLTGVGLVALVAAALLLRWRFPVAAPVVALGATGAGWILGVSTDPMLGAAWCLYPLALRQGTRTKFGGFAVVVVLMLVAVSGVSGSSSSDFDQRIVIAVAAIGASWLLGHVEARRMEVTSWAVQQQAEHEQSLRQAAMARDVHDVVGHALTVISAEADVSRNLDGLHEAELRDSLADIERRARGALEEVQALVRALKFGITHATDIAEVALPELLAAARSSGLKVEARINLPKAPPETSQAVTRVVQEALSNVLRHAQARQCEVSIWPEGETMTVRVDDDGTGLAGGHAPGMGLIGMRERVEGMGGSLTVSNRLEGGTRVLARLPLKAVS